MKNKNKHPIDQNPEKEVKVPITEDGSADSSDMQSKTDPSDEDNAKLYFPEQSPAQLAIAILTAMRWELDFGEEGEANRYRLNRWEAQYGWPVGTIYQAVSSIKGGAFPDLIFLRKTDEELQAEESERAERAREKAAAEARWQDRLQLEKEKREEGARKEALDKEMRDQMERTERMMTSQRISTSEYYDKKEQDAKEREIERRHKAEAAEVEYWRSKGVSNPEKFIGMSEHEETRLQIDDEDEYPV